MNRKYLTAFSAVGVASLVALALFLFPVARKSAAPPPLVRNSTAPFQQVRVYRMPGGGFLRTETLRWQGPGGMTIVTWSSGVKLGKTLPPWVRVELQNMQAQQRSLAAAFRRMIPVNPVMIPVNSVLNREGPWGFEGPLISVQVQWPRVKRAPKPAIQPLLLPKARTVDL